MELETPPKFTSIFRMCLTLSFVSAFTIFFMGHADSTINERNKSNADFLLAADDLQVNFEKSLTMYTESTQASIDYLSGLRPQDETGYIQFISTVENLAQTQGISLTLQTLDGDDLAKDETGSRYIDYKVQFYGREETLRTFLEEVEALPYYTRVMDIHFQSFETFDPSQDADTPNVVLTLRLYVK